MKECLECMGDDWIVTATMISCRACGSMWGRVNGQWAGPFRPATLGKEEVEDGE